MIVLHKVEQRLAKIYNCCGGIINTIMFTTKSISSIAKENISVIILKIFLRDFKIQTEWHFKIK